MNELTRLASLEDLPVAGRTMEIFADPVERASIARRLDLAGLGRFEARLHLSHGPREGIVILRGNLEIDATQTCVVTLDPVAMIMEIPIERYFSLCGRSDDDGDHAGEDEEIVVGIDNEEPEPLVNGLLDVGEIAVEELSLSLDPYPRSPGADEMMRRFQEDNIDPNGPFARLRSLRDGGH
ncbi:MAG: DUF177 domain-containing protein [Geminicoccaceae bacterium]|nr:DUF177 domain-containing protein [Geminicoccaceae bacterium]